jgi:hypothetical protein
MLGGPSALDCDLPLSERIGIGFAVL